MGLKISTSFAFTVIGLITGFFLFLLFSKPEEKTIIFVPISNIPEKSAEKPVEKLTPCTMEAKLCPDGSSVGRTGANCEFAPCPGEKEKVVNNLTSDEENLVSYKNVKYGFAFQYPKECGEIMGKESIVEIDNACLSSADNANVEKIATNKLELTFTKNSSADKNFCDTVITVLAYDNQHYYELTGLEGRCALRDISALSKIINGQSNIQAKSMKGLMEDSYFPTGQMFIRDYAFVMPDYLLSVRSFFAEADLNLNGTYPSSKKAFLEDIVAANTSSDAGKKLEALINTSQSFIKSLSF